MQSKISRATIIVIVLFAIYLTETIIYLAMTPAFVDLVIFGISVTLAALWVHFVDGPRIHHLHELRKQGIDTQKLPWNYFTRRGWKHFRGKDS